jgi:crossover junction endodeoxyribonuclease RuvC
MVAGYGVIEDGADGARRPVLVSLAAGQINGGRGQSLSARLRTIFDTLTRLIQEFRPDCVAVEEPFVDKNIQTALKLGQAEGVALLAAELAGVSSVVYSPATIKLALTGYGRAEKFQVGLMVSRLLRLPEPPASHHAADALAVAICHLHSASMLSVRRPSAVPVPIPQAVQRPMRKQRWLGGRGHRRTFPSMFRTGPRIQ